MKRRTRAQIDPDCVVALSASDEKAFRFRRSSTGVVMEGEWDASKTATSLRSPAATIAVLQTARVVCRTCELPDTNEENLQTALQLQVETQQLGSVPQWRTASSVLDIRSDNGGRTGVVVDWPTTDAGPSLSRDLPPDGEPLFAGDSAILAATMDGYAEGPLVTVSPDRTAFSFAVRTPNGLSVRSIRMDANQWPNAAMVAVVESALRGGMNAEQAEALVELLDQSIAAAADGGFGCTDSDRNALNEHVSGLEDANAWREHGLKALAAFIWFTPKKTLVSLRAQPLGERPGHVGEWLNHLSEARSLVRVGLLCLLVLILAPPIFAGARLLLLYWKVGDLEANETSLRAYQKQIDLYSDLTRRAWPMGKLLGDLANVTPEGVEWEDLTLSQDRNVSMRGQATKHDALSGTEAILLLERQMRDSRVFDKVTKRWDPPDGKGLVKFSLSATVVKPTMRPAYKEAQDFAHKTLSERKYGPTKTVQPVTAPIDKNNAEVNNGEKPDEVAVSNSTTPEALPSDVPSIDPLKDDAPPSVTATAPAVTTTVPPVAAAVPPVAAAVPSTNAPTDSSARKTSRGGRNKAQQATDLPKRSERTPDSANLETPIPAPLSDTQINAMTREETQTAMGTVAKARQSAEVDDETKARLKEEFDKLKIHLKGLK